ncbi:MAG: hypothetical protein Q4B80_00545 [Aerococcaceae bacterium]|nr:hypothetical protein [Aerococcaceae bacterium]
MKRYVLGLSLGLLLFGSVPVSATTHLNIRDKDFTAIEEPDDAIVHHQRQATEQPYTEEKVTQDIAYILQAFYYESGKPKQADIFGMTEEEVLDHIVDKTIEAFQVSGILKPDDADLEITFEGQQYHFREELKKSITVTLNSLQTANAYEITDVVIDGKKVTATIEARSIDHYQYEVMLSYSPKYKTFVLPLIEKIRALAVDGAKPTSERILYNNLLRNEAVYGVNLDGNFRVPLEHEARTRTLVIEMEYDDNGFLQLTDAGLLMITQIKTSSWE